MLNVSSNNTFYWLRNFLILGQIIVWLMAKYFWSISYPFSVVLLCVVYFSINLLYKFAKNPLFENTLFLQLIIDIIELTVFFYLTGGASNPFTWFLLIPIIYSATVLKQKFTWILTLLCIVSYTMLIKFFQPVPTSIGGMNHLNHTTSFSQHIIGMWLGFIVIAMIVAWVIIGLLKNIRHKEDLLMKANLKQAENAKILALATLATGSAHELGTPLATINILIKELIQDKDLVKYHKSFHIIESQILRCKTSLAQITASTGTTQAINGSVVSIELFFDSIKELLDQTINRSAELILKFQDEYSDAKIIADKTLIQAIINIINNAVESEATHVGVKSEIKNNHLYLCIDDNGQGIGVKFGMLVESEKEFGMGLGLFLAKSTIERFSGTLKEKDKASPGTYLEIKIPLVMT